ncbi:MAG: radical SAM protein [Candidatus Hydrogenedentes bacterium]|nr:radical SAM protein [Candidatus Hydrogenedentota bacterium]
MSDVTLVFPRFKYTAGDFSLGLAYLSAYVKREIDDIEIGMIDTTFNASFEYVGRELDRQTPRIVGIQTDTLMFDDAMRVAELAKNRGAFVVLGGPHPTVLPETVMNNKNVDAVCIGEGEITFTGLIRAVRDGTDLGQVAGIWYRTDGTVRRNPPREPIEDVDSLPFPDIEIFDVERYINNFIQLDSYKQGLRGLSVIVSRGCPFGCAYCQPTLVSIFGKKFRIRSPKNVVTELKELKSKYNLDAVYFQDDTLTVSRKWIMEFRDCILDEHLDLAWACNTRADIIDEQMLQAMKDAGLVKVKVGIESICDRVRNGIYRKAVESAQIQNLIDVGKRLGIQVTGFFMLGAPTETAAEIKQTIKFAARSGLTEANFSVTVPLPKTYLYEHAIECGWTVPDRYGDYDYYHAVRGPMAVGDVSAESLERYKKLAYLYFYLHPSRLWNTIKVVFGPKGFRKTIQKLKRF